MQSPKIAQIFCIHVHYVTTRFSLKFTVLIIGGTLVEKWTNVRHCNISLSLSFKGKIFNFIERYRYKTIFKEPDQY